MDIIVESSSESVKNRIHNMAMFYAVLLKLQRFTPTVTIRQIRGLKKEVGAFGQTTSLLHFGNTVEILLDANISCSQLMSTLAHEMVHVKQIVSGLLKTEIKCVKGGGLEQRLYWKGRDLTDTQYLDRPWEKQAFSKESLLVRRLDDFLAGNYL